MVTVTNPDGRVIALYRFSDNTTLGLAAEQNWTLSLRFEDEKNEHHIVDEGSFRRYGPEGEVLRLESTTYGDAFDGKAQEGLAAIKYGLDGYGQSETVLGFQRILGPGD